MLPFCVKVTRLPLERFTTAVVPDTAREVSYVDAQPYPNQPVLAASREL